LSIIHAREHAFGRGSRADRAVQAVHGMSARIPIIIATTIAIIVGAFFLCMNRGKTDPVPAPQQANPGLSLGPSLWIIGPIINRTNYSHGTPLHPSPDGAGWSFNFPQSGGSVHYISTAIKQSLAGKSTVRMKFDIVGDAATAFKATEGRAPARVRLFLQRPADDWQGEFNRWWSVSYIELGINSFTLTAPLIGSAWSSVYGKQGNVDSAAAAGFTTTMRAVENIGLTFGGTYAGHGVNISGGNAKFICTGYEVK
jgi:hypothetical protein